MENLEPDRQSQMGILDKQKKKINPRNLSLKSKLPVQNRSDQSALSKLYDPTASTSSHGMSDNVASSSKDDSLKDFRSPVKEIDMNESLADFKVSVPIKRLAQKESKPIAKKKRHNRDVLSDVKQPSIESSFFRAKTEVQTTFVCPLCYKSYKDGNARMNHMKGCAARNNISTKQLLDALKLQEKQADERKAMGLLVAPPVQLKKSVSRKMISDKDPQLQLALALSMSLHEAQVTEEIEEAHLLVGEPYSPINGEMSEERRKTLQNFGFTTNKPMVASTGNKSRKKRPAGPTVLQTRTQEERDRITTVRIAEVLMGDEPITQALLKNKEEEIVEPLESINLKSRLLQSYHCVEDRLWDKTKQTLNGQSSYPHNKHLESSPCKIKSESNIEKTEQKSSKQEPPTEAENNPAGISDKDNVSARLNSESSYESSTDDDDNAVSVKYKVDQDSAVDLSKDWRCMLGASYMSDVLVVVKKDHTICAHRVVFWARCYSLMDDVTENDPDRLWEPKYRILWPETELCSAYAFLEYVYCGNIEHHASIFDDPEVLAGVRALARKYRLKKLFVYLRDKSNEVKSKVAQIPKTRRIDSKSRLDDTSDDGSHSLNRATSICSKETDINLLSIECNDSIMNKRDHREKISGKEHSRSTEERKKENISTLNSLEVNSSTSNNRLSGKRMSQETPTSIAATITDSAGSQGLPKSDLTPSKEIILGTQNNSYLKVINDETLGRERSVSPDIFDDSESENATSNYAVSKGHCHNFDDEMNENDPQIEFICSSEEKIGTEGSNLLDREISVADTAVANISKEGDCKSLEKLKVDLPFVSTRRTRRNFRNSLSPDDSNRGKSLSGSFSKQKGEITLAIEKMQKLNSKTASESDSECESVEAFRIKKQKNPFRLNITETSSVVEGNIARNVNLESDGSSHRRRRNKLSLFEKKIEIAAKKNPRMFNLPGDMSDACSTNTKPFESTECTASTSGLQNTNLRNQNDAFNDESIIEPSQKLAPRLDDSDDSIFDLTQESSRESKSDSDKDTCDTNTDDKDLSMFTRYKRKNSRNSIDKYRAALRNASLATSVSSSKSTGGGSGALSPNDSKISDSESLDPTYGINSINFSSKYEYTDPNQSRSNFHKELLSMSAKNEEHIDTSRQILSSTESEDREQQSSAKLVGDAEFSDFEIASSDFPSLRYSDEFSESKSITNCRSQNESISTKKSNNKILDDKETCKDGTAEILDVPSYSVNVKLEEAKIGLTQRNLSEEETDTECWIESVIPKNGKQFGKDEEKLTDIYNEETDTEETGERGSQARTFRSKTEVNNKVNDVPEKIPNAQPLVENGSKSSSSECEITGEFQSTSINFDFIKNVSDEIGLLLEECKTTSQSLHNLSMSQIHNDSGPSISNSFVSTPAHQLHGDDYRDITPPNFVNDYEDDTFLANHNFSEAHCSNQNSGEKKSRVVKKTGESSKVSAKKKYSFSKSDSSDFEDFTTCKTKDRVSFSSVNKSKTMKASAGSTPPSFGSVSPKKNSSLSLRTFKTKSISENILKSKSTNKTNSTKDSFDGKFTIARTSSADHNISERIDRATPQREDVPSENVTPLADYSAMKTPELRKELNKYGFKPQKRHRAKQLLRYIYNELHPLVPVSDTKIPSYSNISSSDDEIPAPKRLNKSKSLEAVNNKECQDNAEVDHEMLTSNTRTESESSDYEELENYDHYNLSQSDDSKRFENLFRQLIEVDKDLHNKILTYEPLELEKLHSTLKSQGLKCKLNALMSFLDEQCITFRQMTNAKKSRTRRKVNPQKNQNTR